MFVFLSFPYIVPHTDQVQKEETKADQKHLNAELPAKEGKQNIF